MIFNNFFFLYLIYFYLSIFDINVNNLGRISVCCLIDIIKFLDKVFSEIIIVFFILEECESVWDIFKNNN